MIRKFFSILTCNLLLVSNTAQSSELIDNGDYVVILHGIARSSKHMQNLANCLQKDGFDVINLDYPSTTHTIEELTEIVNNKISKRATENKPIHFVGYSMGGLMVRALLHKYNYPNLGKVVQLAPPNQGSEVADFVKNFWPYRKMYGPAGQQLITDQSAVKHLFGEISYELGIIAGNASIDPISSMIIPGANDGKVAVEKTKLSVMKDHIVVRATHTFFPSSRIVQKQTLHFLKHGQFQH